MPDARGVTTVHCLAQVPATSPGQEDATVLATGLSGAGPSLCIVSQHHITPSVRRRGRHAYAPSAEEQQATHRARSYSHRVEQLPPQAQQQALYSTSPLDSLPAGTR
jgi:hypothetical protein